MQNPILVIILNTIDNVYDTFINYKKKKNNYVSRLICGPEITKAKMILTRDPNIRSKTDTWNSLATKNSSRDGRCLKPIVLHLVPSIMSIGQTGRRCFCNPNCNLTKVKSPSSPWSRAQRTGWASDRDFLKIQIILYNVDYRRQRIW